MADTYRVERSVTIDAPPARIYAEIGQSSILTKAMGIFRSMDKMIGSDFEKGLAQLKATTETTPAS